MTEREQFEAEYRKRSDRDDDDVEESLRRGKDGEYLYDGTWTAFYWWQAARATPQIPEGMALVPVERTFESGALAFKELMIEATHAAIHPHIEGVYGVFEHRLAAAKENQ